MKITYNDFLQMSAARNQEIYALHLAGEDKADLARKYGLSRERVGQIISAQEKAKIWGLLSGIPRSGRSSDYERAKAIIQAYCDEHGWDDYDQYIRWVCDWVRV